ncbi:MAG TPA: PqqD family protein [Terracidiphilus sp.]|nr:PqqD family protein [Terracidiphilus sp.]
MTLNDSLRIPDSVATRTMGSETVLLNLETGTYFGLDTVGSRFIELLESNDKLSVVYSRMLEEYDVEPDTLKADLLRLSQEMCSRGLLEPAG